MKYCGRSCLALVFCVLFAATPIVAHHLFSAEFDANKPVTLRGYVTKIDWVNPHVWFYLNVQNEDSTVTNWGFELGAIHVLQRRGWMRTTMKIGDDIVVHGTLAKNGSKRVNARNVTFAATGKVLGTGSSEGETP